LAVRLEPLYRVRFTYSDIWEANLAGSENAEAQFFSLAEGRCEGRISGRYVGANHPYLRSDGTVQPDFQGVIETDDGAVILFDYRGYGRSYPAERRQIVASGFHLSDDERYHWLNDTLSVRVGEVRSQELVVEWAELVWEPIAE
jgi:hypothetical protein